MEIKNIDKVRRILRRIDWINSQVTFDDNHGVIFIDEEGSKSTLKINNKNIRNVLSKKSCDELEKMVSEYLFQHNLGLIEQLKEL